jgi:hypothetical protein
VTFNHGVEGSSPSALTIPAATKPLYIGLYSHQAFSAFALCLERNDITGVERGHSGMKIPTEIPTATSLCETFIALAYHRPEILLRKSMA